MNAAIAPEHPEQPDFDDVAQPTSSRRRLFFTISGLSLLTLGVFLNAERFGPEPTLVYDGRYELEEEPPPEEFEEIDEAGGGIARHRGEEGKMGKPSTKSKSGLYAMKGPRDAVPQMARNFDPDMATRSAGILGVMQQQQGGQFLASPYGSALAVGNDDSDVWGGLTSQEVGQAHGVGGLGLVGTGRGGGGVGDGGPIGLGHPGLLGLGSGTGKGRDGVQANGENPYAADRYADVPPNVFIPTSKDAKSTFSIDVDTAAYSNTRRYLLDDHQLPPASAVRTEELINYFDYDYEQPRGETPFSVITEVGPSPWSSERRLVHIGIQGVIPPAEATPPRNLVFLLDVSGSMMGDDRLGLVQKGLASLTQQLGPEDRVSIVVYAGAAGAVLPPTSGADRKAILEALGRLEAGGSTNGAQGIELAYKLAERNFMKDGINRVLLATDGDFNVGPRDHDDLVRLIEKKRKSGVFLSVLGVGRGNLNDHMMEQIADKGNGNYAYLDSEAEARKVLVQQAGATLHTIAKDVKIQVEWDPDQVAEHRLVGYENRVLAHQDFADDTKDAGEIGAGHSVTAIYEITPNKRADDDTLATLNLRYKQPKGQTSQLLSVPVDDRQLGSAQTSTDYRFAAAAAAFGEALRGTQRDLSYAQILELAEGALGDDPNCYRHEFLDMVWTAGLLQGENIERPDSACEGRDPVSEPPRLVEPEPEPAPVVEPESEPAPTEIVIHNHYAEEAAWMSFVLEVLRLLPPMLALPMFVLAWWRPRRRTRG